MFDHPDFDGHEGVHIFSDAKSGLQAVIAVHNTARGPSAGGTRLWSYADPKDAVTDALRLSKAMSYKNAMAGLSLGGGKAVIIRPEMEFDRKALLKPMAGLFRLSAAPILPPKMSASRLMI